MLNLKIIVCLLIISVPSWVFSAENGALNLTPPKHIEPPSRELNNHHRQRGSDLFGVALTDTDPLNVQQCADGSIASGRVIFGKSTKKEVCPPSPGTKGYPMAIPELDNVHIRRRESR